MVFVLDLEQRDSPPANYVNTRLCNPSPVSNVVASPMAELHFFANSSLLSDLAPSGPFSLQMQQLTAAALRLTSTGVRGHADCLLLSS